MSDKGSRTLAVVALWTAIFAALFGMFTNAFIYGKLQASRAMLEECEARRQQEPTDAK